MTETESAFSLPMLGELYRHMEWADAKVWQIGVPSDDTRLRELLVHLHVVQRAFLQVWTDEALSIPEAAEFPTLAALQAWARPYYAEVTRYLGELDSSRLAEPVPLPWLAEFERRAGRELETPSLGDTLFQVTSHSTHHRGQVTARLGELGQEPPLVDYIAWRWLGRPDAEWTDA